MVTRMSKGARAGIKVKKSLGMLPPPECPICRSDLRDKSVPKEYIQYAEMFGLAIEVPISTRQALWRCPVCDHTWQKHQIAPKEGLK